MNYLWTTIHVSDMDASLEFYRDFLGLELMERVNPAEGIELAFLGSGETRVELIRREGEGTPAFGKSLSMGFQTASLEAAMKELENRKIPVLEGPNQPGPGIRFLYIRDPDGMKIQLVELLNQ